MKNSPLEMPSLINLSHESKVYEESGCENDNAEDTDREKNMKKMKEITYTKISSYNSGEWAELQKIKNFRECSRKGKNKKK